jgi:hypothetical protein
MEHLQ